jgi:hypothetical protein
VLVGVYIAALYARLVVYAGSASMRMGYVNGSIEHTPQTITPPPPTASQGIASIATHRTPPYPPRHTSCITRDVPRGSRAACASGGGKTRQGRSHSAVWPARSYYSASAVMASYRTRARSATRCGAREAAPHSVASCRNLVHRCTQLPCPCPCPFGYEVRGAGSGATYT